MKNLKMKVIKSALHGFGILMLTMSLNSSAWALSVESQAIVHESYTLESQGQIEQSIKKMQKVAFTYPDDYFVNYRLGWLFSVSKKYRNSIESYEKAAALSPESIEPWLGMSAIYVGLLDYPITVKMCIEVLKRDAAHYVATQRFIYAAIRMKDFQAVNNRAEMALKLFPSDVVLLEQKAFALKNLGKNDEAKSAASLLILLSPTNAYAKSLLTGI